MAIASNRIAPVTVHSIATINQLAPGRVILGFGTGHTGRRVMGLPPVRQAEFREQVRVIRDLLRDGEATYNTEGLSRKIRYLHRDRRFINLDDKIPLYVAANGPKTLALAGEFGDGAITTGITDADRVGAVRKSLEAGASKAGRSADKMPIVSLTHICVLRPGEKTRFAAREGDDRALGDGEFPRDRRRIRARRVICRRRSRKFTRRTRSTSRR